MAERKGTGSGTITIGSTCSLPTRQTELLADITGATAAGTLTVTLGVLVGGVAPEVEVTLLGTETAAEVAEAIAAATEASTGWEATAGDDSVTFLSIAPGVFTTGTGLVAGDTGVTASAVSVTEAGHLYVVSTNVVSAATMPTTHLAVSNLTLGTTVFSTTAATRLYILPSSTETLATVYVSYEKFKS
jgi:hypothetical protein